ncbi:MAG: hypothetical protein HXS41_01325 [Theionarchaea archaeon]|nr:hypothetical protein [Theionarchaea archaeon]MBU7034590.1 hypothetical protein [Theionarchaea archaeon]
MERGGRITLNWLDFVIVIGYIGVIVLVVAGLKNRFFPRPGKDQEHPLSVEKEDLVGAQKGMRRMGPLMIVLGVLSYVLLWYLGTKPPIEYVHLLILMAAYMVLSSFDTSPKLRYYFISPQAETLEKGKESKLDLNMGRSILYVNAAVLLAFCILYAQLRSGPFHGIWGIIAWAGTLFFSYTPVLLVREEYTGRGVLREKRIFAFSIFLSWILVFFWLELGLNLP